MNGVISILKKEMDSDGFRILPCEMINLDFQRFTEYIDSDDHRAEKVFERPTLQIQQKIVPAINRQDTILRYFLDGSRRTQHVADIEIRGQYLPIVAGQVGVAVVERPEVGVAIHPMKQFCRFKNVLALPDKLPKDDIRHLQGIVDQRALRPFELVHYSHKQNHDPVDLAVARIMSEMHDMEIAAVREMESYNLLRNDAMLVIDGPLRFKKKFDLVQFRNVIGLSKTFRPSFSIGTGKSKQDVGALTSKLDFGRRTQAFRTQEEEKVIGMWYLRIRSPQYMHDPLQGIVKIECYAVDPEDRENGIEMGRIDTISGHILNERNVTPYKSDSRWASHIYPVYLAESFLKASFMSDTTFRALLS